MADSQEPSVDLANKVLPRPLFRALCHVFAQGISRCVLTGGTALAGFYAGHRRSDDLDFFTADESHQRSAVLAVKSLGSIGVDLKIENETAQYLEGIAKFEGHLFKITVVLDANLFRVGKSILLTNNLQIVDLNTLFKMKAATLASRCSEKDLYDLIWLFRRFPERTFSDLVSLGSGIDGGVNGEAMLSSVSGAILRKEACGFALDANVTKDQIFGEIKVLQKEILRGLAAHLEAEAPLLLGSLVKKLERFAKN